jgi:hypothetical protein
VSWKVTKAEIEQDGDTLTLGFENADGETFNATMPPGEWVVAYLARSRLRYVVSRLRTTLEEAEQYVTSEKDSNNP